MSLPTLQTFKIKHTNKIPIKYFVNSNKIIQTILNIKSNKILAHTLIIIQTIIIIII